MSNNVFKFDPSAVPLYKEKNWEKLVGKKIRNKKVCITAIIVSAEKEPTNKEHTEFTVYYTLLIHANAVDITEEEIEKDWEAVEDN